jgi:hypothetical protein
VVRSKITSPHAKAKGENMVEKNPAAVELGRLGGSAKSEAKTAACALNAKKLRAKKKCGKCEYLADFPYVHCTLECELRIETKQETTFIAMPRHKDRCTDRRQRKLNEKL